MHMTEGRLASLAVVARKLREEETPLKAEGKVAGLGIGAAALLVEMAGSDIVTLRTVLQTLVNHWNEFGPEHGFEEVIHSAEQLLRQMQ